MSRIILAAALALAATLPSVQAQAQNGSLTRSFVSSAGLDTNSCMITAPCASFAVAYTKISANGIIAALDPGKYGPLTITGPVTINGNGWAAITGPAAGDAIIINAVSGNVILTGIEVDGAGAAYNGIVFNSGSSLTVTNCIVQNFIYNVNALPLQSGNGILMQPTSGTVSFAITNSTFSSNGFVGLYYLPQNGTAIAGGVIDHVDANNNATAISINTSLVTTGTTQFGISNSLISNNSAGGIFINNGGGAELAVSIDNSSVSSSHNGILASGASYINLGRSVITANLNFGVTNSTSPNLFYSYGDNRINGNGSSANSTDNVNGTLLPQMAQ
jgi:hypothetical protein